MLGDSHAGGIRTAACGSDDYEGAKAPVPSPAQSESRIRVIHAVDEMGNHHADGRRARPFLRDSAAAAGALTVVEAVEQRDPLDAPILATTTCTRREMTN
ncbi:hypothetical protein ACIQI8_00270 [Streptomyces sp. NPDC092369]|uniref:hypothetical protein n=1 Tax=Streptomyces sp. NPDC092369 TaxID=3366015 RepID=UPI0037FC57A1